MVSKSAKRAEDHTVQRYVRIDGPWIRNQAQEAVETFIAPAIGIVNAVSKASRPKTKILEAPQEITHEDLEILIKNAKKTYTKEDERLLISDTLKKLNIGGKGRDPGIFGRKRPR